MDPLSLIVGALAQGAATALSETASDAIRKTYRGLVSLVKRRLGRSEDLVDEHAEDPEVWQRPLEKKLREAGAEHDEELINAARALMEQLDPVGAQIGKYNVSVSGQAQVGVIGDHAQVQMNPRRDPG
jgi:hypothetical protein